MAKAYWVNSKEQTITIVDCFGLSDMQRLIGGYIALAASLPFGDKLYVDDEGLLKKQDHFFKYESLDELDRPLDQPLAGNGLLVGQEVETDDGCYYRDPLIPLFIFQGLIRFLSKENVIAWGKANASEPAMVIHYLSGDKIKEEVVSRYGAIIKKATD